MDLEQAKKILISEINNNSFIISNYDRRVGELFSPGLMGTYFISGLRRWIPLETIDPQILLKRALETTEDPMVQRLVLVRNSVCHNDVCEVPIEEIRDIFMALGKKYKIKEFKIISEIFDASITKTFPLIKGTPLHPDLKKLIGKEVRITTGIHTGRVVKVMGWKGKKVTVEFEGKERIVHSENRYVLLYVYTAGVTTS